MTVDIDDVPLLVHGEQPGSGYNSYVGHECYHAVVSVCGESGDILGARLRNPVRERAQETHDLALEAADALLQAFPGNRVLVRMDAGFASGGTFDTFEELNIDFLARIRNNPVLNGTTKIRGVKVHVLVKDSRFLIMEPMNPVPGLSHRR